MATELTSQQYAVVHCNSPLILVSACPGSGKSTTLAARATRLANEWGDKILCVTFSNRAAQDLSSKIGPSVNSLIDVETIHKFSLGIVTQFWDLLGDLRGSRDWGKEPTIVHAKDEIPLISEILSGFRESPEQILDIIKDLRKTKIAPEHAESLVKMGAISLNSGKPYHVSFWRKYEAIRISKGFITFDEMISFAVELMAFPEVSSKVLGEYQHLLIDEAQDTSYDQWKLLRPLLVSLKSSLLVADHNQACYGWRGGDVKYLSEVGFLRDAVKFSLNRSFRSGQEIADAANMVVPDGTSFIITENQEDSTVETKKFETGQDEVDWVLETASGDCAIIARTNGYLEAFERECIRRRIQYSGSAFYRSRHISELAKFLKDVKHLAISDLKKIVDQSFGKSSSFDQHEKVDFSKSIDIIKSIGIDEFLDLIDKSQELNTSHGIVLTTGHASKGLEWDSVFVVGAQPGMIPHKLSVNDSEERNLFYVMVTRARTELCISYVKDPSWYIPKDLLESS